MALAPGVRLGPYEVLAPVGAGGMGEVYRARDPRLGRDVAIKVLPSAFSADPERLHRFEQEARAAAALNHPNILAVHDIGQLDGAPYIVSELLEGETVRERLTGGALPVRKAVEYAVQIAHGLAAAHEKGITHRDLKPENIFVTTDGRVKILDFGLAKLTQTEPLAGASSLPTTPPNTVPGLVLGTIGYMSPEQVRGLAADHRSDIFAFGAILYEMLSGQRAFRGETLVDTMSAILAKDPPDLPVADRHIPPALARIVDRCVEKSASARFQSTRDLAFALEALTSHSDSVAAVSSVPVRTSRQRLAWMLVPGILLLVGAVGGFVLAQFSRPAADERVFRLQIDPPEGGRFVFGTNVGGIALSPDGRTAAYIAAVGGTTGLWVRSLDNTTPRVVPGTVGAAYPFWSPDGTSIAFLAGGKLQRADLSGGTPRVVADLAAFRGGAWTNDGRIILGSLVGGLFQVPASGGKASPLTTLDSSSGDIRHAWPQVLPSGRVLYWAQTERLETTGVYAASLTRPAERVRLLPSEANAIYAPGDHERGHLLWLQGGTLMAQPFDPASLRLSGEPHPIADPAARAGIVGQMHASASMNGVLLYSASTTLGQFAWFDRSGKPLGVASEPGEYTGAFRLSPDGYRAVATRDKPGGSDLWLLELERGIANRFTSTATSNVFPVWSPDGRTIVGSNLVSLFRKSAGGAGTAERVIQAQIPQYPTDWSQDGRLVLYYDIAPGTQRDLWALPVTSEGKTAGQGKPYLRTPFSESWGRFFPEPTPRWVAYQSDVSGRYEVYIDAFPEPRSTTRISTGGGQYPQWGPQVGSDGRELFYLTADFKLMVVTLKVGKDSVEPTTPRELFALPSVDIGFNPYDTTPSGQRFLVRATPEREASQPLTVIVNWPALLKK